MKEENYTELMLIAQYLKLSWMVLGKWRCGFLKNAYSSYRLFCWVTGSMQKT